MSSTTVSGFSIRDTASRAAASGRHRMAMSAVFNARAREAGSLRSFSGRVRSVMSVRDERRSKIRSPVVPALPSIKIFFMISETPASVQSVF